jgi:hypothetical protein
MTLTGLDPLSHRLLVYCLNQLCYRVLQRTAEMFYISESTAYLAIAREQLTCEPCVAIWRAQLVTNTAKCLHHLDCILVLRFVAVSQ